MLSRRRAILAGAAIVAIIVIAIAWWLLSPLFISKTVEEEFPFAASAAIPADMTMAEVNDVMAGMAKVNMEISEGMPDSMTSPGASDQMASSAVRLKSGSFRDADSFHKGSGQATIYQSPDGSKILRLEDFRVTNGPDLHVILTPHPDPQNREDVSTAGYVDLGKLKGNIGNQNYPVPESVDVDSQMSVVIYCVSFHVVFSVATLQ